MVKSLPPRHVYCDVYDSILQILFKITVDIFIVLLQVTSALKVAMKNDYQLTQKCHMIIAAVLPIAQPAGFVLKKGSPHLEIFNRGFITYY